MSDVRLASHSKEAARKSALVLPVDINQVNDARKHPIINSWVTGGTDESERKSVKRINE